MKTRRVLLILEQSAEVAAFESFWFSWRQDEFSLYRTEHPDLEKNRDPYLHISVEQVMCRPEGLAWGEKKVIWIDEFEFIVGAEATAKNSLNQTWLRFECAEEVLTTSL